MNIDYRVRSVDGRLPYSLSALPFSALAYFLSVLESLLSIIGYRLRVEGQRFVESLLSMISYQPPVVPMSFFGCELLVSVIDCLTSILGCGCLLLVFGCYDRFSIVIVCFRLSVVDYQFVYRLSTFDFRLPIIGFDCFSRELFIVKFFVLLCCCHLFVSSSPFSNFADFVCHIYIYVPVRSILLLASSFHPSFFFAFLCRWRLPSSPSQREVAPSPSRKIPWKHQKVRVGGLGRQA